MIDSSSLFYFYVKLSVICFSPFLFAERYVTPKRQNTTTSCPYTRRSRVFSLNHATSFSVPVCDPISDSDLSLFFTVFPPGTTHASHCRASFFAPVLRTSVYRFRPAAWSAIVHSTKQTAACLPYTTDKDSVRSTSFRPRRTSMCYLWHASAFEMRDPRLTYASLAALSGACTLSQRGSSGVTSAVAVTIFFALVHVKMMIVLLSRLTQPTHVCVAMHHLPYPHFTTSSVSLGSLFRSPPLLSFFFLFGFVLPFLIISRLHSVSR